MAELPSRQLEKIKSIFELQKTQQSSAPPVDFKERKRRLKLIYNAMFDYRDDFIKAIQKDFKKSSLETITTELFVVTSEAKYAIKNIKKWMKPRKVSASLSLLGSKSYIYYEPKGVVLVIAPWNFPVNLTFGPLVSAIAAGNSAIIKPSEMTPNTTALIAKIIKKLFKPEEVSLLEGGPEMSQALLKLPFHHIFFTGSPKVGSIVMQAAAKHLASVTLELGGKSPTIVDETANLDEAARKIVWGKFLNNGQICIAPDYLYVHQSVEAKLLEKMQKSINKYYGETSADKSASKDYCRIVNTRHFERLRDLLEDAKSKKASVIAGGGYDKKSNYMEPTILTNLNFSSRIMKEEIFGPILPVISYSSIEEPLEFIREGEKPLAFYIFSKNKKNIQTLIDKTRAGGGCVNDCVLQYMNHNLPFGGSNNSGIGKGHGYFGFEAFSNQRGILKQPFSVSGSQILFPPYGKFKYFIANLLLKYF